MSLQLDSLSMCLPHGCSFPWSSTSYDLGARESTLFPSGLQAPVQLVQVGGQEGE